MQTRQIRVLFMVFLALFSLYTFLQLPLAFADTGVFGYDTMGTAGATTLENQIVGSVFSVSHSGNVTNIGAYLNPASSYNGLVKGAIYSHATLGYVGTSDAVPVPAWCEANWYNFPFSTQAEVTAGEEYIIVVWGQSRAGTCTVSYANGDTNQSHSQSSTYGTWPDPLVPTHGNFKYSIFCNYTYTAVDNTNPTYSTVTSNSTVGGSVCQFASYWSDNVALSGFILTTNNTGTDTNETWTSLSGSPAWANKTLTLNVTYIGSTVHWKMIANDTSNNWNSTMPWQNITTTYPYPYILDLRLSSISDTVNITTIDVFTWYDWEVNLSDADTLNDIINVTIRIKENPVTSMVSAEPSFNRTGEYWFNYENSSDTWTWYTGGMWTQTSDWIDTANCAYPDKSGTSGYYLFRVRLAKSAAQSSQWALSACAYDSSGNVASENFTGITINAYSSLVVLGGNSSHTWANAIQGTSDNLIDQGSIYFNVTANFVYRIQAKGDGNLVNGTDYIGLGNVTIHKDTLGSSVSLTTDYADVGGLTSQTPGEDIMVSVKLWLDVPAGQALKDYTYTLNMQITSQS